MGSVPAWGEYRAPWLARAAFGALRHRLARGPVRRWCHEHVAAAGMIVDLEVDGLKMRCHPGDNYTERLVAERRWHDERANIGMIVDPLQPGDVFVDIGANCGLYTLFAARKVGPAGRVIAVEALPVMQARSAFNVAINGFANVHLARCAVSAHAGEIVIHAKPTQYGQSSVSWSEGHVPHIVPVQPLADIVTAAGAARIDALKIDIEGHEDRALMPFLAAAPSSLWPRRIFIETRHRALWSTDVPAALVALGYEMAWSDDVDMLLVRAGEAG